MSNEDKPKKQEESITILSMAKRLYQLYRPHLGFDAKNRMRTFWAAGIFVGNVLLAFALAFVNVSMASLMGLLSVPGVTYTAFFYAALQCVVAVTSYGAITGIDAWMASQLGSSLTHAINKKLEKRWMRSKAYYGATLQLKSDSLNPSQIISHDNFELNTTVTELYDNFLTTVSNFAVGIIGLYLLSVPLQLSIMSLSFAIPGYLVISTVVYALIYNKLTNKIGDSLEDLQSTQRKVEGKIQTKIHHINTHAEAIAFKKGTEFEHRSLLQTIKESNVVQTSAAKIRSVLTFATNLHAEFTSFFALLLCAPNIIAQKLSFANVLEIPYHFQNVVNFFTWKSDNFDKVTECAVTLERIEDFNKSIKKWENIQEKNKGQLNFSTNTGRNIKINNLTLNRPDGSPILENFTKSIPKGKVTLLQGPSGTGKTSVLRAFADLSPFAKGKIEGLSKNTYFIPSSPYFPMDKSLLEAIMYPRQERATPQEIKKIKGLMNELGFNRRIIDSLEEVKNWYGQDLSDGQKQRIGIICAIMQKPEPEIVIADEMTSRVDPKNKAKVEAVLKKYLPKATIIYTDHNPSNFYDNRISLADVKKTGVRKR